ncbi:MAG: transporter [Polyangiales bacterium]
MLLVSAVASADADVDLRSWRPSTDAHSSLATEGVETPGPWSLQFGNWTSFETTSLKVNEANGTTVTAVGPRLLMEPTIALGLGRRAAIGVALPFALVQGGEASSLTNGLPTSAQGIGDVAITGKALAIAPNPDFGGIGLGFVSRLQLPTGDRNSFISDSATIIEARGLVVYDLGHLLIFTATAGYRARFDHHPIFDVTIGDTLPWGATISLKPRGLGLDPNGHWTWNLEGHGEIGMVPNKFLSTSKVSPVLLGASARYEIAKSFWLFAGVETGVDQAIGSPRLRAVFGFGYAPTVVDEDQDGVPDAVDECPGLPEDGKGANPHDGCPDYEGEQTVEPPLPTPPEAEVPPAPPPPAAAVDTDGDGIPDDVDKCPDQPETKNGYEDEDGCPELDKDNDTFLDAVDKCPDQPETFNGFQDDDGCPDEAPKGKPASLITEGKEKVARLTFVRTIAFDGAEPKEATADLRAIAAWLLAHPGTRVRVIVKPDAKGEPAQKVAEGRAQAIAQQLVRLAHTGNVAEVGTWDPKNAPTTSNVWFEKIPAAAPVPPVAPVAPPAPKTP